MVVVTRPRAISSLSLKFVVVGSSIAGLATAYALARVGHRVLVLEETDGTYRSHGAVYCPPNMTRILNSWGGKDELERVGIKCTALSIYQGSSGELLGKLEFDDRLLAELEAEFYFLRHGDLHNILYDLAVQAGVKFRFNTKVVRVDSSISGVFLEQGETILTDVIVGADGRDSLVRSVVQNQSQSVAKPTNSVTLMATVSATALQDDPELSALLRDDNWRCWVDSGFFAVGCPTHAFEDYNLCVSVDHHLSSHFGEKYDQTHPVIDFKPVFESLDPRLWKIMELAQSVTPITCIIRDPYESAVCENAVICLVGEAGHPMLPNGVQNAAMALEDASTLGGLFAGADHPDQIPRLLTAYEELRQPRWAAVQTTDIKRRRILTLPPGEERKKRDASLRASVFSLSPCGEKAGAEQLRQVWKDTVDGYAYDSMEAVNDWKSKWDRGLEQRTVGYLDGVDTPESDSDKPCI